jgi:hypothetical protein
LQLLHSEFPFIFFPISAAVPLVSDNHRLFQGAITHTNNAAKFSVKATWTPESSYEGGVRLYATMVQDYSTYWTRLPSQLIQVRQVSSARNTECVTAMAGIHSFGRFFSLNARENHVFLPQQNPRWRILIFLS